MWRRCAVTPSATGASTGGQPTSPLFCFRDVRVEVDGNTLLVVNGTTIAPWGITMVVGPSGAGKTTLLRLCNRLEVPTSGSVSFRGTDLAGIDPLVLRRQVGMVFQHAVALEGSVADNLRVANPTLAATDVAGALKAVDLDPKVADQPAVRLSGGERQRLAFARTLAAEPRVLLVDEPTSSLDPSTSAVIEQQLQTLAARGVPVVWVTHHPHQLERLADHVVIVDAGMVVDSGPADIVAVRHRHLIDRFMGDQ